MKGAVVVAALAAVLGAAAATGCPKEVTTLLPDSRDCAGFWRCADGVRLFHACPEGLHFSARLQHCTLPVFARCQAVSAEAPMHSGFLPDILDKLRNVISKKAEPLPPELPIDVLPKEEDTVKRFPDVEARVTDDDTDEAEKSVEVGSENEEQKSSDEGQKNILGTEEEGEQQKKEEEQDKSEGSEEKIEEEEDEVDGSEEEDEEKTDEASDVEDVAAGKDDEDIQDSKKDITVVKKKDEEEEDEDNKKSKDVKRKEKETKKNKPEDKEKDSESDAESDDD